METPSIRSASRAFSNSSKSYLQTLIQIIHRPILVDRSSLLRVMETMVFSPLLLTGATSQKQRLDIVYTSEFYNDPGNMAARIEIEIQSQFIQVGSQNDSLIKLSFLRGRAQIYSSHLRIHAELSGLRYVMHHHPWLSSLSGILANVAVLTIIILISWTRSVSASDKD